MKTKLQWPLTFGLFVLMVTGIYLFTRIPLIGILITLGLLSFVALITFLMTSCYFLAEYLLNFKRLKDEA